MPAHHPVLLTEVLRFLDLEPGDHVVDATVGTGGHARAILERTAPSGTLLGIDLDPSSLKIAQETLKNFSERVILVHDSFDHLTKIIHEHNFPAPDALIADLGVSSVELRDPSRGFSFQLATSPLDMRFDASPRLDRGSAQARTAADIVNEESGADLERIIREYGEERHARSIARSIAAARSRKRIVTVGDLVAAIEHGVRGRRGRIHPATRTFQALRIAVNDELGTLTRFLPHALNALVPFGRLAVISFHSLEDRIVKQFFRAQARAGLVTLLTKHPATPSFAEVTTNPRSRSAKLRVVVRRPHP